MPPPDAARLPPLDLLLAFEAAARLGSFTQAAGERFVTQSAMSRQIRALEDQLGVPLFERRHRALALTAEGERLYATCGAVLVQLRATVAEIRAPRRRELVSLTTTPGLAALWLIPRLTRFTRLHPGLDVRVETSFEQRRLASEGFDLAIRHRVIGPGDGQPLFAEAMQPVCSPALLRDGPPLAAPADLAGHTLLQMELNPPGAAWVEWTPWLVAVGLPELQPRSWLSFSSYDAVVAAALAGQGVALGRRPLVDGLLARGELVTPFADQAASPRGYYVMVEASSRARPAVRALERWLLEEAQPAA